MKKLDAWARIPTGWSYANDVQTTDPQRPDHQRAVFFRTRRYIFSLHINQRSINLRVERYPFEGEHAFPLAERFYRDPRWWR